MSLTIHRTHPIVRLAYLFNGQAPPMRNYYNGTEWVWGPAPTSLCPLFWRCVLTVVGVIGFGTMVSVLVGFIGWKLYHVPWHTWRTILICLGGGAVGALAFVGLISIALRFQWGQKLADVAEVTNDKIMGSAAWQTAKAAKSKLCPMVTFTESREA